MTTSVLVADDQPLMRAALRSCLEAEHDITVVGEVGDGAGALRLAERLRPDVVVMDVRMPILDGIEATRRLVASGGNRSPGVLMMTTFDIDENIIESLRAGAKGFLLKDTAPEELVQAVRLVGSGQAYLTPSVTRRLLDLRAGGMAPMVTGPHEQALASVTARELAVLKLIARGMTNGDIAVALDLAPSSVKTHVGHLLAKLRLSDRVQLVVFAYEHELVRPGSFEPIEETLGLAVQERFRTRTAAHPGRFFAG